MKPTTHPIQVSIRHTGDGETAFDGISYEKGASWIKTMDNFIGRPALQAGLKSYVQKFAYKSTELPDLVKCLDTALKQHGKPNVDLLAWTDDWLKTKGPNVLETKMKEKVGGGI